MALNKRQRIAVLAGIGLAVVMGVFPPWVRTMNERYGGGRYGGGVAVAEKQEPAGYGFLAKPPPAERWPGDWSRADSGMKPDLSRLSIQWACVGGLTAGAMIVLGSKKEKE